MQPSSASPTSISLRKISSTRATPASPPSGEAGGDRPGDERRLRAERERLQHVGAAPDAAVDVDLAAPGDRLDDLGQRVERRRDPVELPAAVIRDDDPGRAVLDREQRVLARQQPLQHDRQLRLARRSTRGRAR